jgi:Hypoxia induced protein conserved region
VPAPPTFLSGRAACRRGDFGVLRYHIRVMTTALTVLLVVALLGVLGVLAFGMANMFRGGSPRTSNRLMQARVVMQGIAILVLALLMMTAGHH